MIAYRNKEGEWLVVNGFNLKGLSTYYFDSNINLATTSMDTGIIAKRLSLAGKPLTAVAVKVKTARSVEVV